LNEADETQSRVTRDSILRPEGEIIDQEFSNLLDTPAIQSLLDDFSKLTDMVVAILDLKGKILVASGWRDICTQFHRVHPQAAKNCMESDLFLAQHIRPGEYAIYKCKNNLWDVVTPLYVEGKYAANIYTGQFFYDTDVVDDELFVNQAKQFGFDPEKYLAALHRVPRFSRDQINTLMDFLVRFSGLISQLVAGNQKLFRALVDQAPEAIVVYDADINRFVDANRKAEKLFGCSREELLKYGPERFYPIPQPNGHSVDNSIWEHIQRALDGEEPVFERTIHTTEEKDHYCKVQLVRLPSAEHRLLRASFIDITEHKRAEEALRQEKLFSDTIIKSLPGIFYVVSRQGRFIRWNKAVEDLLEVTSDQLSHMGVLETFHEDDRELVACKMMELLEKGHAETEARSSAKGSPYFYFSAQRMDVGDESYIVGTALDITDRKRVEGEVRKLNEELEQRVAERTAQFAASNKELEAFSYSVSHDLRAPLRSIDGFSHLIEEEYRDQLDAKGKDYLSRVRKGCRRMSQLIDDLLNLSRITRSEITRKTVDLGALAREITTTLQTTEPERPAEFVIAENLQVNADENLARIVLENLFANAWKFTKDRVPAKIELGMTQRDKTPVYFIRDNGIGFDMTYASKLFQPFQRLHSLDDFPGTGIGLATVQRIILRHGGQIWAEGEVNHGAAFFFTL
jgi:PAS domain S-box-containing protein